jgi:hypothetical protein
VRAVIHSTLATKRFEHDTDYRWRRMRKVLKRMLTSCFMTLVICCAEHLDHCRGLPAIFSISMNGAPVLLGSKLWLNTFGTGRLVRARKCRVATSQAKQIYVEIDGVPQAATILLLSSSVIVGTIYMTESTCINPDQRTYVTIRECPSLALKGPCAAMEEILGCVRADHQ